jgi:hypothetical protein
MKKILMIFTAIVTFASCEKSNEDPYNYMIGGTWIAQHVDRPVSDDSIYSIKETYSLEDMGLSELVIKIYKIERNNLISTNALGEISEYAYGQFGWSLNDIEADSAIYIFKPIIPGANWPSYVNAEDYFIADATFCSTCGDLLESAKIHKRSENEMAILTNKGWIVYTR